LTARFPENYAKLVSKGFYNAYLAEPRPACTFCYDNPLNEGGPEGTIIDHIFVKHFTGRAKVERILTNPIDVRVGARTVRAAYSDHYGLKATLSRGADDPSSLPGRKAGGS
jgi:hypothetical protein